VAKQAAGLTLRLFPLDSLYHLTHILWNRRNKRHLSIGAWIIKTQAMRMQHLPMCITKHSTTILRVSE
jgi:hypothetical protein